MKSIDEIMQSNKERALQNCKCGRNKPCPCSSGKKFKKCCLPKIKQPDVIIEKSATSVQVLTSNATTE